MSPPCRTHSTMSRLHRPASGTRETSDVSTAMKVENSTERHVRDVCILRGQKRMRAEHNILLVVHRLEIAAHRFGAVAIPENLPRLDQAPDRAGTGERVRLIALAFDVP